MWGFVIGAAAIGERLTRGRQAQVHPAGAMSPPAAVPGAMSPPAAPVAAAPGGSPGLTRAALMGVLVISGAGLIGSIFHVIGLGAIGTLLKVLSWITFSGVTLIGAGAWLRAEFKAGTLSRMWGARRRGNGMAPAPAAPAVETGPAGSVATPPADPPVTPAGA
jgi:hypothetical protein